MVSQRAAVAAAVAWPGESRTIRTELEVADARGEQPRVEVEGLNAAPPAPGE